MKPTTSRRRFLKQAFVASAAAIGCPSILRADEPNSVVQIVCVGANGMGYADMNSISTHAKVKYVGFCDVDTSRFDAADKLLPGVPHWQDFREMFDKLGDKFDAVNIATPDHMHALVAVEAMRRGKHVYCQKPLTRTVWESRQLRLWAEKKNVITQMGNQIHSANEYRLATRLIHDGVIGKVKEVHSWIGVTGNERTRLIEPPPPGPVPASLNWDLWIGCAPMRDYAPKAYHPFVWRDWQDFGSGALGDFGCHVLDPVFTALKLQAPLSVIADNSGINNQVWPVNETVRWVFPANDLIAGKTLNVTWSDGGIKPARKLAQMPPDMELPGGGSLFIGENGNMVLPHVGMPKLYPEEKFKGFAAPALEKVASHWHRWIDGIRENKKTSDGFHYASWLNETVQLGNVATRLSTHPSGSSGGQMIAGKGVVPLEWDAENLKFTNKPEGAKLITREYRAGWEVKGA